MTIHTLLRAFALLAGTGLCGNIFAHANELPPLKIEYFIDFLSNIHEVVKTEYVDQRAAVNFSNALESAKNLVRELQTHFKADDYEYNYIYTHCIEKEPQAIFQVKEWPTPAIIKDWQDAFTRLSRKMSSRQQWSSPGNKTYEKIVVTARDLYWLLADKILIDEFFCFSFLDKAFNCLVDRPLAFVKKHPYATAAGFVVVASISGYFFYQHLKEAAPTPLPNRVPTPQPLPLTQEQIRAQIIARNQQAVTPWAQQNDAEVILTLQDRGAADCSIWSLYRQWCYEYAVTHAGTTDMTQYRTLTTNMNQYNAFKAHIEATLAAQNPGRQGPLTRNLDDGTVSNLIQASNRIQGPFSLRSTPPVFQNLNIIDPALINDGSWDAFALQPPANAIIQDINNFNQAPGNHMDFIVNLAVATNANMNPGGHYIHVRAINDPVAQQGVRLIYSESATPNIQAFNALAQRLRNFLNPAQ